MFRPYLSWKRDRPVALTAVFAVLAFGVLDGLLASIAISLMMLLRRMSQTSVCELGRLNGGHDFVSRTDHPEAQPIAGVLILRPDEPLFFANVERILATVRERVLAAGPSTATVVVSLEDSFDLDSSSVEALVLFFDWMRARGTHLILARLKHPAHQLLRQVVPVDATAPALLGLSVDDAVTLALTPGAAPGTIA